MRIWGVLCLVSCISNLNAKSDNMPEMPDEKPSIGVISHVEERSPQEDSDASSVDPTSFLKETSDKLTIPQEDLEKQEPFLIVTDPSSPPGGVIRFIDPKIEKMFPPLKDAPWWERWWNAITSWFSGEISES